jgi:hypothetical protein
VVLSAPDVRPTAPVKAAGTPGRCEVSLRCAHGGVHGAAGSRGRNGGARLRLSSVRPAGAEMRAARWVGLSLAAALLWAYVLETIFKLAGVLHRRNHPRGAYVLLDADLDD